MNTSRWWILGVAALGLTAGRLTADPPSNTTTPTPSKIAAAPLLSPEALAARIDHHLGVRFTERDVKPAPLADDAEFMRRLSLDLTGRIPRVADLRDFLEEKAPNRRSLLVERLLEHPHYVTHFGTIWTTVMLPPANQNFQVFARNFKGWIEKQVRENVAYDKMVRELLTTPVNLPGLPRGAVGIPPAPGRPVSPLAFFQANELKAENLAASASRVFLGVRLECAQCHDHPFANWTRKQFWEYAAFFQPPPQPPDPNRRTIKIAGTEKVVEARFLDGAAPQFQPNVDSRITLANWMTTAKNPYFARTAGNRLWGHFFGIGLLDPVDDEPTEDNPASHPELLAELTTQFAAHDFDIKYLIRAITASKAYQRASAVSDPSQNEPRLFARMAVKGLTPEQLFDSLAQATGYKDTQITPQGRINPLNARTQFLQKFASQEKRTEYQTSILQALSLMNGKFIADATSVERSTTLAAVIDAPFMTTARRVETLYLATLSRLPRAEELARMVAHVDSGGPRGDTRAALTDVFWVLLNSSEFILNH